VFEFTVAVKELKQAIQEIGANREADQRTDPVDIVVSSGTAKLHSVGTKTEVPVAGREPGSARLPFIVLENIGATLRTLKDKEVAIVCQPGALKIGTMSVKHPDIKLGIAPKKQIDIPVDLPVADTLALTRLLSPEQLSKQGLRERVDGARTAYSKAISEAVAALQRFSIGEIEVRRLVDKHIEAAVPGLRHSLKL
jgi:hypothetical protein